MNLKLQKIFILTGITFFCFDNVVKAEMISSQSVGFHVSSATDFHSQNDSTPTKGGLDKVIVLEGFDSNLGNLTGVDVSYSSEWNLQAAISGYYFGGGEFSGSAVAGNQLYFRFHQLGNDYLSYSLAPEINISNNIANTTCTTTTFNCFSDCHEISVSTLDGEIV